MCSKSSNDGETSQVTQNSCRELVLPVFNATLNTCAIILRYFYGLKSSSKRHRKCHEIFTNTCINIDIVPSIPLSPKQKTNETIQNN